MIIWIMFIILLISLITQRQFIYLPLKRHKDAAVPIIALTANATSEDRQTCKQAGMNDVITKPFKRADLSDCLQRFLSSCRCADRKNDFETVSDNIAALTLDPAIYRQLQHDMGEDFQQILDAFYSSFQTNLCALEILQEETPLNEISRR